PSSSPASRRGSDPAPGSRTATLRGIGEQGTGSEAEGEGGIDARERRAREAVLEARCQPAGREPEIDEAGERGGGQAAQQGAGGRSQGGRVPGRPRVQAGPEHRGPMVDEIARER